MRIVGDEIVAAYQKLCGKLEVLAGFGYYPPLEYGAGPKDYRPRFVAKSRFGQLSTWLRWNPHGKDRPTFEQFLLAYGLKYQPD